MYNCPHTGVALAALAKLLQRGDVDSQERVVVLFHSQWAKVYRLQVQLLHKEAHQRGRTTH